MNTDEGPPWPGPVAAPDSAAAVASNFWPLALEPSAVFLGRQRA